MSPSNPSVGEQAPTPVQPERPSGGEQSAEQLGSGAESSPTVGERVAQSAPMPTVPLPPPVALPVPQPPAAGPVAAPTTAGGQPTSGPATAADVDVIEKPWVDKSKELGRQFRDDPYTQEKETSRLKSDYVKKRYNKDVKPSE